MMTMTVMIQPMPIPILVKRINVLNSRSLNVMNRLIVLMETLNVRIMNKLENVIEFTKSECDEQIDSADGDAECTYNEQTGECYGIVRSQGIRGNGNFDDGYNAAKNAAKEESDQLNTIVGVLGGIIGALILVIAGGAYYIYTKD